MDSTKMATHLDKQSVFSTFLRSEGLKATSERRAVVEAAFATPDHFAADDLLVRMRLTGSSISKATIYRTLSLLVQCGMLREVISGEKHVHYEQELAKGHHDHLICFDCGRIIEFSDSMIESLQERICREYSFSAYRHKLEITGICHQCQDKH